MVSEFSVTLSTLIQSFIHIATHFPTLSLNRSISRFHAFLSCLAMLVFLSNLNSICGALCGRNRYLHSNSRTKIIISSPFSVSRPPRRRPSEIFRKHRIFRISPIPRSGGIARNGVPPLQSGMFYRLFVFRIFANWRNVGSYSRADPQLNIKTSPPSSFTRSAIRSPTASRNPAGERLEIKIVGLQFW